MSNCNSYKDSKPEIPDDLVRKIVLILFGLIVLAAGLGMALNYEPV